MPTRYIGSIKVRMRVWIRWCTNREWRIAWKAHQQVVAAMPHDIREAHKHSMRHREEVQSSDTCGCFYCGAKFDPAEITEWVDDGKTALCPRCGIDSVIGSAAGFPLTAEFLTAMADHWF